MQTSKGLKLAVPWWRNGVPVAEAESLAREGIRFVETGSHFLENDDASVVSASGGMRRAGISVLSCHAPFGEEHDLSSMDDSVRRKAVDTHLRAIRRAGLCGAGILVLHPGHQHGSEDEKWRWRRLYSSISALLGPASGEGLRLALENMPPGYLGDDCESLMRAVGEFASPSLGVCLDTGHAHLTERGLAFTYSVLKKSVISFHLHDNDGQDDKHLQPPYGTIDWDTFRLELSALDFQGPLTVESMPWNRQSWGVLIREVLSLLCEGLPTLETEDRVVRVRCSRCGRYCFGRPGRLRCACNWG